MTSPPPFQSVGRGPRRRNVSRRRCHALMASASNASFLQGASTSHARSASMSQEHTRRPVPQGPCQRCGHFCGKYAQLQSTVHGRGPIQPTNRGRLIALGRATVSKPRGDPPILAVKVRSLGRNGFNASTAISPRGGNDPGVLKKFVLRATGLGGDRGINFFCLDFETLQALCRTFRQPAMV